MPGHGQGEQTVSVASEATGLQFRVLGSVGVAWNGVAVDIGGFKSRALVARLLVDRGLVVSVDQFAESLWAEEDQRDAAVVLRSTLSRLRKRLRAAGVPDQVLITRTPGYLLDVPASATDAQCFADRVAEGRRLLARGDPAGAERILIEAEGLWRGSAYGDVRDEPFARAEARRLEELRLTAAEARIDAALTLGRHRDVVGELQSLIATHPLRERLWSQWMLALYRSGRQAEALRVYQDLRAILVTELGIEPGHDVAWMEHAILTHDPALDLPVLAERAEEPGGVVSSESQPPAPERLRSERYDLLRFAGRDNELGRLWSWWDAVRADGGRTIIIEGEPGIGKSRLVTEFARAVARRGHVALYGRCDRDPVASYQPFAEALGRYFESLSADRLSAMPAWQRTELSRLVVRLQDPVQRSPAVPAVDPPGERLRFFDAVAVTLAELATEDPVLLVMDDLHYADDSTMQLLRHVIRRARESRIGVVGTYVQAEIAAQHPLRDLWGELRPVHAIDTLHLHGLPVSAVQEITEALVEGAPDVVPRLYQLTAGNPLFLDEILRPVLYAPAWPARRPRWTRRSPRPASAPPRPCRHWCRAG